MSLLNGDGSRKRALRTRMPAHVIGALTPVGPGLWADSNYIITRIDAGRLALIFRGDDLARERPPEDILADRFMQGELAAVAAAEDLD